MKPSPAVDLNGLVGLASATVTASLVDETVPGTVTLTTATITSDSGWAAMTAAPAPGVVVSGHTYHLSIRIAFSSTLSLVSGMGVNIDNVTLSVTPSDDRADGELRAPGVPVGSTNTLELRARTSAEPFDVQVWNGSAWIEITQTIAEDHVSTLLDNDAANEFYQIESDGDGFYKVLTTEKTGTFVLVKK